MSGSRTPEGVSHEETPCRAGSRSGRDDEERRADRAAVVAELASAAARADPRRGRGSRAGTGRAASPCEAKKRSPMPPPTTTAGRSSRFTAEAIPAPSAFSARSTAWSASASSSRTARHQTPLVSRSRPRFSMILKRVVWCPLGLLLAHPRLHHLAAGVGLDAAAVAAAAEIAAAVDDLVAELAGEPAAVPHLALQHQAAADAGAPPHAERASRARGRRRAGTRLRSRRSRRCPGERGRRPSGARAAPRAGRGRSSPGGCARWRRSRSPRRRRPACRRRCPASSPASAPASASAACSVASSASRTASGPPSRGVSERPRPRTAWSSSRTSAWIFVPPRSMPPRRAGRRAERRGMGMSGLPVDGDVGAARRGRVRPAEGRDRAGDLRGRDPRRRVGVRLGGAVGGRVDHRREDRVGADAVLRVLDVRARRRTRAPRPSRPRSAAPPENGCSAVREETQTTAPSPAASIAGSAAPVTSQAGSRLMRSCACRSATGDSWTRPPGVEAADEVHDRARVRARERRATRGDRSRRRRGRPARARARRGARRARSSRSFDPRDDDAPAVVEEAAGDGGAEAAGPARDDRGAHVRSSRGERPEHMRNSS